MIQPEKTREKRRRKRERRSRNSSRTARHEEQKDEQVTMLMSAWQHLPLREQTIAKTA